MAVFHPFLLTIKLDKTGQLLTVEARFMGLQRTHTCKWDDLPLQPDELENADAWIARGYVNREAAFDLGSRLADTIFQGDVRSLLDEAEGYLKEDEGLRLMLELPSPAAFPQQSHAYVRAKQLHELPWELLHSSKGKFGFFAQSRQVALARHDSQANLPNHPPDNAQTLRVLIINAASTGPVPLDDAAEVRAIREALSSVGGIKYRLRIVWRHLMGPARLRDLPAQLWNVRRFEIAELAKPTRASIINHLFLARDQGKPFHVIHFIGHGESDETGSYLWLHGESEDRPFIRIEAEEFLNLVVDADLSLMVVNACESAAVSDPVVSVAHKALKRGVPVVIGMRIAIFDRAAIHLARDFYSALAAGEPVEAALARARILTVRETRGKEIDWSIPLLYMGWSEGLTFPPMKRRPFTWLEKLVALFMALIFIAQISGTLLDIPETAVEAATTAPGIKCLHLHSMDENKFTVAFYNFAVIDEDGNMVITDDGRDLAQFLYNRFEHNFAELALDIPYELRPPSQTCAIYGKDEKTRAERAARIAQSIQADVLIYGTIINARTDPRLKLEFHVSNASFAEGGAIIGSHALGGLLKIERPFDPAELLFIYRPAHVVRTDILNQVIFGLSYYSVDNYELAADFFRKAAEMEGWPDSDGKDVVYLLLGNTAVRQSARENDPTLLDEAENYYKKAQAIAPGNVRAKLGLASVLQSRAVGDMKNIDPDSYSEELLTEAETLYLDALQMAEQADADGDESVSLDQIKTTVDFAIGQIYYNRWLRDGGGYYAEAEKRFDAVVAAHDNEVVYQPYRAGRALGYLAHIEWQRHDNEEAEDFYERAIELSSPFWQTYYSCRLSEFYCSLEKETEAAEMLQSTIDIARLYGQGNLVDYYVNQLEQLKNGGCFEYQCRTVFGDD